MLGLHGERRLTPSTDAALRGRIVVWEVSQKEGVLRACAPRSPEADRAAFDREVNHFRRQGYAIIRGQRVPGLTAIAVPIFDIHDDVKCSLTLTGPSVRVDPRDHELAEIMMTTGRDISSRLGASAENGVDLKLLAAAEEGSAAPHEITRKTSGKTTTAKGRDSGVKSAVKPRRRGWANRSWRVLHP